MDPVGVNSIETAALGRPFQLGMLYDCRRDALVPGIRLWTKEQLQQNITTNTQINTVFTVSASDSIEDKSKLLNIDGCLKLSLIGGLLNVAGAANFLKDTKKSFNQQRLTLHYHSTTKFEELIMNHVPSGEMAHYDNDVATHVVTAVLYGADACFVFDREVSSDENKMEIAGEVKAALEQLKGISSAGIDANMKLNRDKKTAVQKFNCTFYGDFQLSCNPTTFEDAMKVFEELPTLLGENKERAVPLRVWLYPLDKLFSRAVKFQHEISTALSADIESVIESLSTAEMKCSDLLTDTPALTFTAFHDKINDMKKNCYQCRLSLIKKLGSLLPKIRGKFIEDSALIDLLNDHEESPFERSSLEQWLNEKEEESEIMKALLAQLKVSGAMVEINLNKNLMDLEVQHLVSYTFTSLGWPDVLLSEQKSYLSSSAKGKNKEKSAESKPKTWLATEIQKAMRNNLRVFKSLIAKLGKSATFIVASKEIENNPGSCILLFENESNEAVCFTPPSKPDCPTAEDVRSRQVVFKVSPACPATEELRLMYKMKEEADWRSQTVSKNQNTVTLTDLRPDTEYSIKCAAVGKLNYTVESDVMRLTVINQHLIKAKESAIENLSWTESKCSLLLANTNETTFTALYKKIQEMQQSCETYRQDFSERIKSAIQSIKACEKESSALKDLLQAHDESPFNEKSLKEWIAVKEKESNTVNEFLQQLQGLGAEVNGSLDSYLSDIQVENVFCFAFSSLGEPDELLAEQENYTNAQTTRNPKETPAVASRSWLTGGVREKMREDLKAFKELMTAHGKQSTKFMVSTKDHQKHPGSCILVYGNGCNEEVCFIPPSKPESPVTEDVQSKQVMLKVSPGCSATEELRLMYKMKEEADWRSQTVWKNQNTVTLTDLRPDTEYSIKCAAVGKLNYTVESDVTSVITKANRQQDANKTPTLCNMAKPKIQRPWSKEKHYELIEKSTIIEERNPARYRLKLITHDLDPSEPYRKMTFGERDLKKPHKTILMVGETGTGKTTLINAVVNYMLGVKREDKVWFEITDDEDHSSTAFITVYGVYDQKIPEDLTIIDTPGYGNAHGINSDKELAVNLLRLFQNEIDEVDAVCLVIDASQTRLSDRQIYIFDAVQSLFGRDVAENIVLLFTHSTGAHPKNVLMTIEAAKVKCAVNDKMKPVHFLFDNCQSTPFDERYETIQEQSWKLSHNGMMSFFKFLENIKPKQLKMTRDVLKKRKQLEANVSNLQLRIQAMDQKQNELKQTQEALEKNRKYVEDNNDFEYEAEVSYKEKVPLSLEFWHLTKEATCCSVCEENCHYPGCWWVRDLSWCSVMRKNHCTVCTNRCHYSKHVKEAKIYVAKTRTEKRTYEDLKKEYDGKIGDCVSLVKKLEEELHELEKEKIMLLSEAYYSVETLETIALNTDSLLTLLHIDFLIVKLKEINEPQKAETLENIKKRAGEENTGALGYIKCFIKRFSSMKSQ
ncbi:uncharacterized protein LOC122329913 isoform X2 [Puntigrus tetrazona]|uniref:uncharacterized protein LOC122329913 isoform X2 n=1 Tax=Puntigrus tetrazona TaxID=1606681 RepID=UPI001C89D0B5|nr:uncharacterized protein LOC122329913 isoform X2 [Puntigrus tetrazona]